MYILVNSHRLVASCQFYRLVTNLSFSSSCNKSVKIKHVATCHLQTCYNLLKQLAPVLLITSLEDQLATSLLTTDLSSTSCRDIRMRSLFQDVNSSLQLVRFCADLYTTNSIKVVLPKG